MTTSSSLWTTNGKKYNEYFAEDRAAPPPDKSPSITLANHETFEVANRTKKITPLDPSALDYTLGTSHLNLAFVEGVIRTTGPVIEDDNVSDWKFAKQPRSFPPEATSEMDFYPWFNWVVCAPAANAVNAVCDKLRTGGATIPAEGYSRTDLITNNSGGGATDIIHRWFRPAHKHQGSIATPCTPHEFKRAKVLLVGDESTLDFLVERAGATASGYEFRSEEKASTLPGKGSRVVCQTINEMVAAETGHAIICTQEQYVMLRLTSTFQLQISPVYKAHGSTTQARDMALLVLFYTHAAVGAGTKYDEALASGIIAMQVMVPAFPTSVFRLYEGVFRSGALNHRTKLIAIPKPHRSYFPLPWVRFDGDVRSGSNDVTIAHGRLVMFFLTARVVAKTAHGPSATQRLDREFHAYAAMRALQGVAIPKVIGLYMSTEYESTVLILSYAGKSLQAFSELEPDEKRTLFCRLVRLHQSGIQHNDLEPRNVTRSESSGPVIIDFDHASLDHTCTGASCDELLQLADTLDLDPAAELSTLEEPETRPNLYTVIVTFFTALVLAVCGIPRRI